MRRGRIIAVFGGLIVWCGFTAGGVDPQEVPVSLRIGSAQVRLHARFALADAVKGLPTPGELPVADTRDRAHGGRTYCYQYPSQGHSILVELHDSDFGLYSARLSRVSRVAQQQCPLLQHEPEVLVGKARYRLDADPWRAPTGFKAEATADSLTISREWVYSDRTRPHMWGTCFSRSISITIEPPVGTVRSITVQNWEEPGC